MRSVKVIILVFIAFAALTHRSDGQQRLPLEQQFKLAAWMPKGASVYLQASDMKSLMARWMKSSQRAKFYKSPSLTAFSRSRIYLKLAARLEDVEKAAGFGLNESRLAELAGGVSSVAVYDIGNTEIVFATETPRSNVAASALFKLAPRFQERTAEGFTYYSADVATDGGRLKQQFCFTHSGGMLVVTTTEGLMLRTLRNLKATGDKSDTLLPSVIQDAERVRGFNRHDLTLWIDHERLKKNRYFLANWIYKAAGLSEIESGLIDLRIGIDGMVEERWFKLKSADRPAAMQADQVAALMKYVPSTAQMMRIRATGDGAVLSEVLEDTLIGESVPSVQGAVSQGESEGQEDSSDSSEGGTDRYSSLDSRFDSDVDDPRSSRAGSHVAEPSYLDNVSGVLAGIAGGAYAEVLRSGLDPSGLFAGFERAAVIAIKEGRSVDRSALEQSLKELVRRRFTVPGVESQLEWRDQGPVRYLAQSLPQRTPVYAIQGGYILIGSSRELVSDCLKSAALRLQRSRIDQPATSLAMVRVSQAKNVFDKLMKVLDRTSNHSANESEQVPFFSGNISSLIGALSIREINIRSVAERESLYEQVRYLWQP